MCDEGVAGHAADHQHVLHVRALRVVGQAAVVKAGRPALRDAGRPPHGRGREVQAPRQGAHQATSIPTGNS